MLHIMRYVGQCRCIDYLPEGEKSAEFLPRDAARLEPLPLPGPGGITARGPRGSTSQVFLDLSWAWFC